MFSSALRVKTFENATQPCREHKRLIDRPLPANSNSSDRNSTHAMQSTGSNGQAGRISTTDQALPHDLSLMSARLEMSHDSGLEPAQAGLEVSQPGLHVTDAENLEGLAGLSSHQPKKPLERKVCGLSKRKWVWRQSWTGYDTHAGIGCHNGGPVYTGGTDLPIFVTIVNSQFDLEIWTMSMADAATQFDQLKSSSAWTNGKYILVNRTHDRAYS
jgi:hypothetical protein